MVGVHKGPLGYYNPTLPNRYTQGRSSHEVKDDGVNVKVDETKNNDNEEENLKENLKDGPKGKDEDSSENENNSDQFNVNDSEGELKERRKSVPLIEIEDETEHNTKLNALLYHQSEDTIDLYKQQNNSADLLGRLYYDDYDSDSIKSPLVSGSVTPTLSPVIAPIPLDFQSLPSLLLPTASQSSLNTRASTPTKPGRPNLNRLQSFERGVSFDTSRNEHRKSLIFKLKHPQYRFRRNNKTFLTGFNNDTESLRAIEWLFEEMVINGDSIVVLQVLDEKTHHAVDMERANRALAKIDAINSRLKKVSLVYEVVIGKPQKLLKKAIDEYRPAMMCIGTHHYDGKETNHRSFLSKQSFSKHFLECALVPVIIVKPSYHHIEELESPILNPQYFQKWIADIDISGTYTKKRTKPSIISPTNSRNSSYTNLAGLNRGPTNQAFRRDEERGRNSGSASPSVSDSERSRSRSTSKSRGFRGFFSHH